MRGYFIIGVILNPFPNFFHIAVVKMMQLREKKRKDQLLVFVGE